MSARIVVFAKAPVPGTVKTRLAPALGAEAAARLHAALVERTLATAVRAALGPVELCCAPAADHPFFAQCAARFAVALGAQGEGDLGQRMQRALERAVGAGERVLLVGTDCPAIDADYLARAAAALDGARVVLGPAEDGGYVLVGARDQVEPAMFVDVAWGESTVLATTRARLRTARVEWTELPALWDVDRPADVARLRAAGWFAAEVFER